MRGSLEEKRVYQNIGIKSQQLTAAAMRYFQLPSEQAF